MRISPYLATLPDYGYFEELPSPSGGLKKTKRRAHKVFDITKANRKSVCLAVKRSGDEGLDLGSLMAKIDARIAEIEAEETAETSE